MEFNPIFEKESGNEYYQGQDSSSGPSGTMLHNEDNPIVLDSEEEQLEEDDSSIELNSVSEKRSDNEQDSSIIANNDEEGDNSINSIDLGGTIINTISQSVTCNEPEVYSESEVQNAISCGDFGRVVQMKTQVNLTDDQSIFCCKSILFLFPITSFPLVYLVTSHDVSSTAGSKATLAWYTLSHKMEGTVNIVCYLGNVNLE